MATTMRNGGLIIEISGDLDKLRADLKKAKAIAKGAGGEIASALYGSLNQKTVSRDMLTLIKYMDTARSSGKAMQEHLKNVSEEFRKVGEAINLSGNQLDTFSHLQEKMYKTQTHKAFMNNLEVIQRLTGATKEEMNLLARSMGGVSNEFSKATAVSRYNEAIENAAISVKNFVIGYKALALANKTFVSLGKELVYEAQFFSLASKEVSNYKASLLSLQSVGSRLFKVMGGWTAVASAVVGGIAYLAFQDSRAEKAAKSYGTTLEEVNQRYRELGESANLTAEKFNNFSQAHKDVIVENVKTQLSQATKEVESYQKELQKVSEEVLHNIQTAITSEALSKQLTPADFGMIDHMALSFPSVGKDLKSRLNDIVQTFEKSEKKAEDLVIAMKSLDVLQKQFEAQLKDADNGFFNLFNASYKELKNFGELFKYVKVLFDNFNEATVKQKKAEEGLAIVSGKKIDNGEGLKLITEYAKESTDAILTTYRENKNKINEEIARGLLSKEQINKANQALSVLDGKINSLTKGSTSSSSSNSRINSLINDIKQLQEAKLSPIERIEKEARAYLAQGYPQQTVDQWKKLKFEAIDATKFTEASRALQEFEKEYQSSFKNTKSLSDPITSQMDKYREAVEELKNQGKLATEEIGEFLVRINELQEKNKVEQSRDAIDGAKRAFQNYADEATNAAKNIENAVTNTLNGLEDAIANFVTTGKLQFSDLANSIISDLARVAVRQSIVGPLSSAFSSLFGGAEATSKTTVPTVGSGSINLGFLDGLKNNLSLSPLSTQALGDVFSSTALGSYSDSVVASPSVFPFAKGIGLMGEAGAEAIMPLTRTSGGHLGVRAIGGGNESSSPVVNVSVVVNNHSSSEVTTQQRQDNQGNMTLEVIVKEVDRMLGNNIMNGTSKIGSAMDKSRGLTNARKLYDR